MPRTLRIRMPLSYRAIYCLLISTLTANAFAEVPVRVEAVSTRTGASAKTFAVKTKVSVAKMARKLKGINSLGVGGLAASLFPVIVD